MHSNVQGDPKRLVLVLVGPSGTGKTLSAETIGLALFEHVTSIWNKMRPSMNLYPNGFFHIRGEEFSDRSIPTERHRESLLRRIADSLDQCEGKGVILIDEAGKLPIEVLDALLSSFKGKTCSIKPSNREKEVSCARAIFIFTTNLPSKDIQSILREGSSKQKQAVMLRNILEQKWKDLSCGTIANMVVPFTPFRPSEIADVVDKELYLWALRTSYVPVKKYGLESRHHDWAKLIERSSEYRTFVPKDVGYHRLEFSRTVANVIASDATYRKVDDTILYNEAGAREIVDHIEGPLNAFKTRFEQRMSDWLKSKPFNESMFSVVQVYTKRRNECDREIPNEDKDWVKHFRSCYDGFVRYCMATVSYQANAMPPDENTELDIDTDGNFQTTSDSQETFFTGWTEFEDSSCTIIFQGSFAKL